MRLLCFIALLLLNSKSYAQIIECTDTKNTVLSKVHLKVLSLDGLILFNGFTNDKGKVQLESSPEVINLELENEKANKFYIEEIGLDWNSKFQDKIMELFNDNQVDECPF